MRRDGIALVEILVALALLTGAAVTLAALFIVGARTAWLARVGTMTTLLAAQKMEQLRGLAWGFGEGGEDQVDVDTDASTWPESPSGGTGLRPSPTGALTSNVPGFVDYADVGGAWIGAGPAPPPDTVYVRRWSIEPLAESPVDTLVLRVVVLVREEAGASSLPAGQGRTAACLTTVRSRRAR
jgi:hypothetical protein